MAGVRTAISIEQDLFTAVNKMARNMKISRSRLISDAVKDYLKKQENKRLLAQLNDVYADDTSEEENLISKSMGKKQRKIIQSESW